MAVACTCAGGRAGGQVCNASGTFDPCDCTGTPFDAALDAPDASDATPVDGATDTGDAGVSDGAPPEWDGRLPATGVCTVDGWCWRNPLPINTPLTSVWGSGPSDIWAVGVQGTIIHSTDAVRWHGIVNAVTGTTEQTTLRQVTGSGPSDIWVLAQDSFLHWDGTRFARVASGTAFRINRVWARAPNDAWAVGAGGTILRWDGARWSSFASGTLRDLVAVWGFSASDVWVSGTGTMRHWNGSAWADATTGLPADFSGAAGLWGAAPNDLWATGARVYHWTGAAWSTASMAALGPAAGSGPNDVYILGDADTTVGRHWDGIALTMATGTICRGRDVWARGPGDFIIVGTGARQSPNGTTVPGGWCNVEGNDGRFVYRQLSTDIVTAFVGQGTLQVFALGPDDAFVHTPRGFQRWTRGVLAAPISTGLSSDGVMSGSGPNDIWVTGPSGALAHWDGTRWTLNSLGVPGFALPVFARSPTQAWTTASGQAFAWNGTAWTSLGAYTSVGDAVAGVWASGPSDVWVYGSTGISRYDGTAWRAVPSPLVMGLTHIAWGTSSTDVWISNTAAQVAHWDGMRWTLVDDERGGFGPVFMFEWRTRSSRSLWATVMTRAALDGRRIRHWNGTNWESTLLQDWVSGEFVLLDGTGEEPEWVSGYDGNAVILHRGP